MGLVYISFPLYVMATKPFAGFSGSKSRLSASGFLVADAFRIPDGGVLANSDDWTTKIRNQKPRT